MSIFCYGCVYDNGLSVCAPSGLFTCILGAHYLALYSLKLDTSMFALLPVGLLAAALPSDSWALLARVSSLFNAVF